MPSTNTGNPLGPRNPNTTMEERMDALHETVSQVAEAKGYSSASEYADAIRAENAEKAAAKAQEEAAQAQAEAAQAQAAAEAAAPTPVAPYGAEEAEAESPTPLLDEALENEEAAQESLAEKYNTEVGAEPEEEEEEPLLTRKDLPFIRNPKRWRDGVEGTIGAARGELDERGQHRWEDRDNGDGTITPAEFVVWEDTENRLKDIGKYLSNPTYQSEEFIQELEQEAANIDGSYAQLIPYFDNNYKDSEHYQELHDALVEERNMATRYYNSLKDLNEYYSYYDDDKKKTVDPNGNFDVKYYEDIGGMTPQMIREEVARLETIKNEATAVRGTDLFQDRNEDAAAQTLVDVQNQLDYYLGTDESVGLLAIAEKREQELQDWNDEIDLRREKYLFSPDGKGWDWTAIEASLLEDIDKAATEEERSKLQKELRFVQNNAQNDKLVALTTQYENASLEDVTNRLNELMFSPNIVEEAAASTSATGDTPSLKSLQEARNDRYKAYLNEQDQNKKNAIWDEIEDLDQQIKTVKDNRVGFFQSIANGISNFATSLIDSFIDPESAIKQRQLTPDEQLEVYVLQQRQRELKYQERVEKENKLYAENDGKDIGDMWAAQAAKEKEELRISLDSTEAALTEAAGDYATDGKLSDMTIRHLKENGVYDDVVKLVGGESVSDEKWEAIQSEWAGYATDLMIKKQEAYFNADDELSYAQNLAETELSKRSDYNAKVEKGKQLFYGVVTDAMTQLDNGAKKSDVVNTLVTQGKFSKEDAENFVSLFSAWGIGTDAVSPRLEGMSEQGKVSLLEQIFSSSINDYGAKRGYFTETQANGFFYRVGDGQLTEAAQKAIRINSKINHDYKEQLTKYNTYIAEAVGKNLTEPEMGQGGLWGRIAATVDTGVEATMAVGLRLLGSGFDFIKNQQQLSVLGQTYSSEAMSLREQGNLWSRYGMAEHRQTGIFSNDKYNDFFYNVEESTIGSMLAIASGEALSNVLGLSGVAGTGLPFFGDTAAEAFTTLFVDTSFASSAYMETFEELKWAGVDETVADKAALASGFAEAFFEHFSVENLIHMKAPKTATQFFRNLAMQGFTESSEELATSVANRVINDCLGEHSDFRQRVDYYMRTYHTTESEAKRYAMHELVREIAVETAAGFISGAAGAGFRGGRNYLTDRSKEAKQRYAGYGELLNKDLPSGNNAAQMLGKYLADYEFIPSGEEKSFSQEDRDTIEAIQDLAETVASGNATNEDIGRMYLLLENYSNGDIVSEFAYNNPEFAAVHLGAFMTGYQDAMIALFGPEKASQYMKAFDQMVKNAKAGLDYDHVASDLEVAIRQQGAELSDEEINEVTKLLGNILTGNDSITVEDIANAVQNGPLKDQKVQMGVWNYLQNRVASANDPLGTAVTASREADAQIQNQINAVEARLEATTDDAERIVLEQRLDDLNSQRVEAAFGAMSNSLDASEADLVAVVAPLIQTETTVTADNVGNVVSDTLSATWTYLNQGNKIQSAKRRATTAVIVHDAESGKYTSSALAKGLSVNRSDNDYVKTGGKTVTRKQFVTAALTGKNAITGGDLPFGNMTEARANDYFDGRILSYAMAPQSEGEAFTEKYDLINGRARDPEAIKRYQALIERINGGSGEVQEQSKAKPVYRTPKNATDKTLQTAEERLEAKKQALTKQRDELIKNSILLTGPQKAVIQNRIDGIRAQLAQVDKDLNIVRSRRGRLHGPESLSGEAQGRNGSANVRGAAGAVSEGPVGSVGSGLLGGGGSSSTELGGRTDGQPTSGRIKVYGGEVAVRNGFVVFDSKTDTTEDNLTEEEKTLIDRAKKLGAKRVLFVNADGLYYAVKGSGSAKETITPIAGMFTSINGERTIVFNTNENINHGEHETNHALIERLEKQAQREFLDGFISTVFKGKKKLLNQLNRFYTDVFGGAYFAKYGKKSIKDLTDTEKEELKYAVLEEIFCDLSTSEGFDRMASDFKKTIFAPGILEDLNKRALDYIYTNKELAKFMPERENAQAPAAQTSQERKIVGTNNMTVKTDADFEAVQNAVMKLKDKEHFFFQYNGQQFAILVDESKDYGTAYKALLTKGSQIFNGVEIGSSDTAKGAIDLIRNQMTPTTEQSAQAAELADQVEQATETTPTEATEEKPKGKKKSGKKSSKAIVDEAMETEDNLRATENKPEELRKDKNGKTAVDKRKWGDRINNFVDGEGKITRAAFIKRALDGWEDLDDLGYNPRTMAEAQDLFDEFRLEDKKNKSSVTEEEAKDPATAKNIVFNDGTLDTDSGLDVDNALNSPALEDKLSVVTDTSPLPKQTIVVSDSSVKKSTRTDHGELYLATVRDLRNEAFRNNEWFMENLGEGYIDQVNAFMDDIAKELRNLDETFQYLGLEDLSNATITLDPVTNRLNLTAMVPNSEYELNFDFSTICERRQALQQIVDQLLLKATYDNTGAPSITLNADTIMAMNKELQKAGINTQCLICFVETKRFNQAESYLNITTAWNDAVRKKVQDPEAFDFARGVTPLTAEQIENRRRALEGFSLGGSIEKVVNDLVNRLAQYSPDDLKLLRISDIVNSTGRTNLSETFPALDDILKKKGQAAPKAVYGFTPYNGEIESMTYTGNKFDSLQDYVKSIGGVRSQSFSDFIISHVFDHLQKTAGLAAMDLPAHTYTKVLARAVLFGMTGEKINMSILCALDRNINSWYSGLNQEVTSWDFNSTWNNEGKNARNRPYKLADAKAYKSGDVEYIQSFPWDQAVDYMMREGYAGNIGPIVVGLSYWHNMLLQQDPYVSMVIGYHSSSMPENVKKEMGVSRAADYTPVQNTLQLSTKDGRTGIVIPNYIIPEGVPSYATKPQSVGKKKGASAITSVAQFSDYERLNELMGNGNLAEAFQNYQEEHSDLSRERAAHDMMIDILEELNNQGLALDTQKAEQGHGDFDLYKSFDETGSAYDTADDYVAYCFEHNEIPMFYEFFSDPNYFKRLFDFQVVDPRSYNTATGRYTVFAPQGPVRLFNENGELLLPGGQNGFKQSMRDFMREYNAQQGQVYDFLHNEEAMGSIEDIVTKSADPAEIGQGEVNDTKLSVRVEDPATLKFLNDQIERGEVTHTYKTFLEIVDDDGTVNLYPPMASMQKNEKGKRKMAHAMKLGVWEESVGNVESKNIKPDKYTSGPNKGKQKVDADGYKKWVYELQKEDRDLSDVNAAYDPYQHSSNVVLNDQFESAYKRPRLVTYECIIPNSELTSGYWYQATRSDGEVIRAALPVGMHEWHKGAIASDLKNTDRQVYMTRWLMPVRRMDNSEVARMYKDILDAEDKEIAVPFNVVSPGLQEELEKIGVPINYDGTSGIQYYRNLYGEERYPRGQRIAPETKLSVTRGTDNSFRDWDPTEETLDEWLNSFDNWMDVLEEDLDLPDLARLSYDGIYSPYSSDESTPGADTTAPQEPRRPSRNVENGIRNRTAYVKQSTMNHWLSGSGFAATSPDYAQAYIGWMHPDDFLYLTTHDYNHEDVVRAEGWYGDEEELSRVARNVPIQLLIDHEDGKVYGHEGRHRMDMLQRLGVTNVPVLFFDSSNKNSKTRMITPTLTGQGNTTKTVDLDSDLIPLNGRNRDLIEAEFVNGPVENEEKATVRFSVINDNHNKWAPVFYSRMQQTIEDWTNGKGQPLGDKMSAQQVEGWLKGKGVKDEEIKWSGIRQYLEGKKSVTRDELLQVMAENEYQIETEAVLPRNMNGEISYYDTQTGHVFEDIYEVYELARERAKELGYPEDSVRAKGGFDGKPLELVAQRYDRNFNVTETPLLTVRDLSQKGVPSYASEIAYGSRWSQYALPGRSNYREILFKNPSSNYTNRAMEAHWGDETGVLAHARVDDMTDKDGNSVLFVEEIQSDWHNAGAKYGFNIFTDEELNRLEDEYLILKSRLDAEDQNIFRSSPYKVELRSAMQKILDFGNSLSIRRLVNSTDAPTVNSVSNWIRDESYKIVPGKETTDEVNNFIYGLLTDEEKTAIDYVRAKQSGINDIKAQIEQFLKDNNVSESLINGARNGSPLNAPYAGTADTYHEYVMKHMLRMAAEGDYDKIGWTTAQQQSDRWSDDYAEGYRIEYDQNIPKFMRKYVKQWGANIGSTVLENGEEVWSVDITPQMKQDVLTVGQPKFSVIADPNATYDAFGDEITLPEYELTDLYQSDLSENLYYSDDGNTAYYQTPTGETVVLNNVGTDSPEARYIEYLEATSNANNIDTTATKPYIIPPRSRDEANGYNLGQPNVGLRRGAEEVPETNQEGTLRRAGSTPELYGQSGPQSEETESVENRFSISMGPDSENNKGDLTFPIVNENGETISTADLYPVESFEQHLLTAMRDGRTQDMEDVINEWVDRGGRMNPMSWDLLTESIRENDAYTEENRQAMYEAIEKAKEVYGKLAKGNDDKKPGVILPKKVANGDGTTRNLRKFTQTAAANVDNELLTEALMFKAMTDEMLGYTPQSNAETVKKARDRIKSEYNGDLDRAYDEFRAIAASGKLPSAVDIALGEILIKEFGDGDKHPASMNKAINVAADLAILGTNLGQAVQALRIIKSATPQGQLYYLEGVVKHLNKMYSERINNGKMSQIKIKEALATKLLAASTRKELNAAIEEIKNDLATQIPANAWDKWNAWRYLAMLGNPRTHIRNMAGNGLFAPIVFTKDVLLRRLQQNNNWIDDKYKTMAVGADLTGWMKKHGGSAYVQYARRDYQAMQDIVKGKKVGNKYADANDIMSRRRIFDNDLLQKYNEKNSEYLEREDTFFQEKYYIRYLAEYLQAQGIKASELETFSTTAEGREILNRARQYAAKQAQRDTYHEANQFAMALNQFKGHGGWRYVLGEGLVPFTATPANLLKLAAVQYSPYGLIKAGIDLRKSLQQGNKDTAEILDRLASGMTGTGIILLGAFLRSIGLLRGAGPDDDKEADFEELQGHQNWAIELSLGNGKKGSYTIDWMAPLCMPMFVGATLYDLLKQTQCPRWQRPCLRATLLRACLRSLARSHELWTTDAAPHTSTRIAHGPEQSRDSGKRQSRTSFRTSADSLEATGIRLKKTRLSMSMLGVVHNLPVKTGLVVHSRTSCHRATTERLTRPLLTKNSTGCMKPLAVKKGKPRCLARPEKRLAIRTLARTIMATQSPSKERS